MKNKLHICSSPHFLYKRFLKPVLLTIFCSIFFLVHAKAYHNNSHASDSTPTSTMQEALLFIERNNDLKASEYWLNLKPQLFIENLRSNILKPLNVYEGSNTNFCGYAALTYLPLHEDPLGYAKFMLQLYKDGKATYGKVFFEPSKKIKQAAGTLKFKGMLDIRPADQMWFLSLADHFKGYVNVFNRHYNAGDENKFWASVNYAKFNRMVRKLFNYEVHAKGSDLIHPGILDLYGYISDKMQTGITSLYLNNAYLHKRKHNMLRPGIPTHFVILLDIFKTDDLITITYWDYGYKSLRQISPAFLKRIVFGVSQFTKK